jgi:hypothetical protein
VAAMMHISAVKLYIGLFLSLIMSLMNPAWSETATATDTEEVIVAREILQPKTNTTDQNVEPTATAPQPQIANDMAEGQVQRDLPSMNEPVIDQANLLTRQKNSNLVKELSIFIRRVRLRLA